jgi:hypothetical protein
MTDVTIWAYACVLQTLIDGMIIEHPGQYFYFVPQKHACRYMVTRTYQSATWSLMHKTPRSFVGKFSPLTLARLYIVTNSQTF